MNARPIPFMSLAPADGAAAIRLAVERVIASVEGASDELTKQWKQILRWMLVARLDDQLNHRVEKVYKVSSLDAGSLISGALIAFEKRDQDLQSRINQGLQEFRQMAARATELRARQVKEAEAAARRAEQAANNGPAGDG